jgi:hypothetical protein
MSYPADMKPHPGDTDSGSRAGRTTAPYVLGLGLSLLLYAATAVPHHGTSAYDMTEEISLTGTVKEWRFQNPHTWLWLDVAGPDGEVTEWSIESAPPNYMARQGWSAESLERGEEVTILISPLRNEDEPNSGILLEIDPANGEALIVRPLGQFGRPATAE